ncbi:hypothetical protein DLR65_06685 [Vibrio tarriae]|uniref:Ail/Lom family outer membrane beta-barrel protein n=1 Tax=Vibrio tarriae TaxID=2014742 RepID=UPI000DE4BA33|nr:Ail/Lom family outer membrane beta-barrel protein [Vibrio tarriae]RBM50448.1 hypothetical protein DLR65_06685 [Vibrio tarriae]
MKNTIAIVALLTASLQIAHANAADHTFSVGYAQTDIKRLNDDLKGLAFKYRYEPGRLGLLVGLTGTVLSDAQSFSVVNNKIVLNSVDRSYGSFHIGPTYRFNDVVSGYATLGYATYKIENKSGKAVNGSIEDSAFAVGTGIELNLTQSFSLNTGIEYSEHLVDTTALTYTVGLGYRF